jgi:hypothetical protein
MFLKKTISIILKEDLAKYGYEPNMKYKSLMNLLYICGNTLKTKI